MTNLEFKLFKSVPGIWMCPVKNYGGLKYWEYVPLYMYDALCISQRTEHVLRSENGNYFYVKKCFFIPTMIYIGQKNSKVALYNGIDS